MNTEPGTGYNKFPKENPFGIPGNYFETFSARLDERMERRTVVRKIPGLKSILLTPRLIPVWAGSVMIMLVLAGWYVFFRPEPLKIPTVAFTESIEMTGYYYDEYTLVEAVQEEDIPEMPPDISKQDILQYLLKENIDIHEVTNTF